MALPAQDRAPKVRRLARSTDVDDRYVADLIARRERIALQTGILHRD